ncbi:MAG: ABC transporter ATP-binding protein [Candidatus Omnitrophica bacterium]|nr:ABC transporter ATP-binding protein [Candidatus Omnitrophota bacterium]
MIQATSLRVDYEGVTAVRDVDLQVSAGQVYGLVGPNGAGKTSTLKALAGIIIPTYGDIRINGIDLEINPREALRQLGFMPDFPPVYERLKVCEYLEVFAAAHLCERKDRLERARHWIDRVRLQDKWDATIQTLSRGMRQRLVLAKTLLHEPKVLLLDEPASGLDPLARMEMRDILKEVAAGGRVVIISSHILTELSDLCNAVGIMEKGKMVVSGSIDEIRARVGMTSELVIRLAGVDPAVCERAQAVIREMGTVGKILSASVNEIIIACAGESPDTALLLSKLVGQGIPVSQSFFRQADMEDIFLKVGARETS